MTVLKVPHSCAVNIWPTFLTVHKVFQTWTVKSHISNSFIPEHHILCKSMWFEQHKSPHNCSAKSCPMVSIPLYCSSCSVFLQCRKRLKQFIRKHTSTFPTVRKGLNVWTIHCIRWIRAAFFLTVKQDLNSTFQVVYF
jgi:hypothetical protein